MSLLDLLFQFLSRLSFGLALALLVVPARQVPSGFFRNHLYVLLGLNVLAALIAFTIAYPVIRYHSIAAAVLSYVGSVAWLYEKPRLGKLATALIMPISMACAAYAADPINAGTDKGDIWVLDAATSGALLGMTIGAMFLGHYYLNSPSMKLDPLRNLLVGMCIAVFIRFVFAASAATWNIGPTFAGPTLVGLDWTLLAMRWLAGLIGPLMIAWMAWQTLKIPNTQSATGILYVGVIFVFLGELAALVLSGKLGHPI